MEPLYCAFCGAYDQQCDCDYPTESTEGDAEYCEACGGELWPDGDCSECDL